MAIKKGRLKCFLFVLIALLLVSDNYAAEKLNLGFRPKPGQKHRMQVDMTTNMKQSIGGKQQNVNHTKTIGLDFEIEEVDANGISLIKVTYQALREKTESEFGNLEYDSKKPCSAKENSLAPMYTAMIGRSFTVKVTSEGKIIELIGLDEMFSQMAEKMIIAEDEMVSKLPPGKCTIAKNKAANRKESQEQLAKRRIEGMNKMYGSREKRKQALKEMIEKYPENTEVGIMKIVRDVITVFAGRPVGVGDSWNAESMLPYPPLPVSVKYTLKGSEKGGVSVDVSSKIDLNENDILDSAAKAPKPQIKATGTYQGTMQVDKTSGWVIAKKVKTQLSGQVTQQGITVPSSTESVVTVELMETVAVP